jgi:hypothetical protein
MAASCNVRTNTINKFRELKLLYENSMRITSPTEFDYHNQYYSNLAKDIYNINMNELMFYIEKQERQKFYIQPLPFYKIDDTEIINMAIPNERFFEVLQERFYDKKNLDELVNIEYTKSLKENILYTGPFNKVELEKYTNNPELLVINEEKDKEKVNQILLKNKKITDSFLKIMYNLGQKNVFFTKANEQMILDSYYDYVLNFPDNQNTEDFNKFVIKKIIQKRKEESKALKNINNIKTNTSFPDINLEC